MSIIGMKSEKPPDLRRALLIHRTMGAGDAVINRCKRTCAM
jgi:hypothetical protein